MLESENTRAQVGSSSPHILCSGGPNSPVCSGSATALPPGSALTMLSSSERRQDLPRVQAAQHLDRVAALADSVAEVRAAASMAEAQGRRGRDEMSRLREQKVPP